MLFIFYQDAAPPPPTSDSARLQTDPTLLWVSNVFPSPPSATGAPMSREEQLLRERKRLCSYGFTSYELSTDGRFIIPANNKIYTCHHLVICNFSRNINQYSS